MSHLKPIFGTLALLLVAMACGMNQAQAQFPEDYGTGNDGTETVNSEQTLYTDQVRAKVVGEQSSGGGQYYIELDPGHYHGTFSNNDKVVIVQMEGTGNTPVGYYAVDWIKNVSGTTLELDGRQHAPENDEFNTNEFDYNAPVQVIRVPEYESMFIEGGGTVTCHEWNGNTGGILMFYAYNQLEIQSGGLLTAKGKGYSEQASGAAGGVGGSASTVQPGQVPGGDAGGGDGPGGQPGECVEGDDGTTGPSGGNGSLPGNDGGPSLANPGSGFQPNRPNFPTLQERMVMGASGAGGHGNKGGQGGGSGGAGGQVTGQNGATNGSYGTDGGDGGDGGQGGRGGGVIYIKAGEWIMPAGEMVVDASGGKADDGHTGGKGGQGGLGGDGANGLFTVCDYTGFGGRGGTGARGDGADGGDGGNGGSAGMFWWTFSGTQNIAAPNIALNGGEEGGRGLGGNPANPQLGDNGNSNIGECDDHGCDCGNCGSGSEPPCEEETKSCHCNIAFELLSYTTFITGNVSSPTKVRAHGIHPNDPNKEITCKYINTGSGGRQLWCEVREERDHCDNPDITKYTCDLGNTSPCDDIFENQLEPLGNLNAISTIDPIKTLTFGNEARYDFPGFTLHSLTGSEQCSSACGQDQKCDGEHSQYFHYAGDCPTAGSPGEKGDPGEGYPVPVDEGDPENNDHHQQKGDPDDDPGSDARKKKGTGMEDDPENFTFRIYPVPAREVLNIHYHAPEKGDYELKIQDAEGKTIKTEALRVRQGEHESTLDIDRLSSGTYFLTLSKEGEQPLKQRFVVQ